MASNPIHVDAQSLKATPRPGDLEYDGSSWYVVITGGVRMPIGIVNPPIATVTSGTTLTYSGTQRTILGDTTSGGFTTTLPTAVGNSGYKFVLKKIASANTWTINTTSSQTIDGGLTASIITQYASIVVQSDGANWQLI